MDVISFLVTFEIAFPCLCAKERGRRQIQPPVAAGALYQGVVNFDFACLVLSLHTGTVCTSFGGFGSMHVFCLRPDYRYLVCRIATYLSVFYNPIAICSKLSVYCYFVRNCLCVGILFKIALVFAAKTIMLEHCPIFVVFVVTYT